MKKCTMKDKAGLFVKATQAERYRGCLRSTWTGPFRWVIYRQGSGELLATSESFYMPDSPGGVTRTAVSLGP